MLHNNWWLLFNCRDNFHNSSRQAVGIFDTKKTKIQILYNQDDGRVRPYMVWWRSGDICARHNWGTNCMSSQVQVGRSILCDISDSVVTCDEYFRNSCSKQVSTRRGSSFDVFEWSFDHQRLTYYFPLKGLYFILRRAHPIRISIWWAWNLSSSLVSYHNLHITSFW